MLKRMALVMGVLLTTACGPGAGTLGGGGGGGGSCSVWTGGTACDACANQNCCAESQACANVASCAACSDSSSAPASCASDSMWNAAVSCIRNRCAAQCMPAGTTGGGGGGGGTVDCRTISCSSGAECGLACGNYCKPTGTCGRD